MEVPHNRYVSTRNHGARRNAPRGGLTEPLTPHPSSSDNFLTTSPHPVQLPRFLPNTDPVFYTPPVAASFVSLDRQLAPLEYLQTSAARARDPLDDEALRQFQTAPPP